MEEKTAKKILIIDDQKELVLALSTLLKAQGYITVAAYDGLFGVSLSHQEKPDLVILDLGLPAGGGFNVLKILKDSVKTNNIPVVVLTAEQGKDTQEKAKQMGAVEYFTKPFEPALFLSRIKEIVHS